jgi:lactoylglutathione lyase
MRLGYVIHHVPDVPKTVEFYERAFGLTRRFVHESGDYAEMETGGTALAFGARTLIERMGLPCPPSGTPVAGIEIALVTDAVETAFERAVSAGATPVKPPERQPWGQTVAYVRDPDGFLVELCTPV